MDEFALLNPHAELSRWRQRLPHWQQERACCSVTWRQADSLPASKLSEWKAARTAWLAHHPLPWDAETERSYYGRFSSQLEEWLDQGYGTSRLRAPACRALVAEELRRDDGVRHDLIAYALMPNHVHVLVSPRPEVELGVLLKSWKGASARSINRHLGRRGIFWERDYWDRLIRDERHFFRCVDYILGNPRSAGLQEDEAEVYLHPSLC